MTDTKRNAKQLYSVNRAGKIISIEVVKETPKGYKVNPLEKPWGINKDGWGVKFIRKATMHQWFPTPLMALQWYREILKRNISYTESNLAKAHERVEEAHERIAERKDILRAFDADNAVVSADEERGDRTQVRSK